MVATPCHPRGERGAEYAGSMIGAVMRNRLPGTKIFEVMRYARACNSAAMRYARVVMHAIYDTREISNEAA